MAIGPTKPPIIFHDAYSRDGLEADFATDYVWHSATGGSVASQIHSSSSAPSLRVARGRVSFYLGAKATPDTVTVSFFRFLRWSTRPASESKVYDLRGGELDARITKAGRRRHITFRPPCWQGHIMRVTISYSNNGERQPSVASYVFRLMT